jgi:hypothetical protein
VNAKLLTRARAWFLRTFASRGRKADAWVDEPPQVAAGPPRHFTVGELIVDVTPVGLKAAGTNSASLVYEVAVSGGGRRWSSRYGFEPAAAAAETAAQSALAELYEVWSEPEVWRARLTAGMSEDEAEAMFDSAGSERDRKAAAWAGPLLAPDRDAGGLWPLADASTQ